MSKGILLYYFFFPFFAGDSAVGATSVEAPRAPPPASAASRASPSPARVALCAKAEALPDAQPEPGEAILKVEGDLGGIKRLGFDALLDRRNGLALRPQQGPAARSTESPSSSSAATDPAISLAIARAPS